MSGGISELVPLYIGMTAEGAIEEPRDSIEAFFSRMRGFFRAQTYEEAAGGVGSRGATVREARAARLATMTYEDILETKVICGVPEQVVDKLTQFRKTLGLSGIAFELNPGGLLPPEAVQRSLRLLTEEVMPAFK